LQRKGIFGLTAADLARLDRSINDSVDVDALTEFSLLSKESEITSSENVFDVRFSTMNLVSEVVAKIVGFDVAPNDIKSFLMVDFYDHESKMSEKARGFEPVLNTLFSFKNHVDSFYISYLQTEWL